MDNSPIDVPDIEDLPEHASHLGIGTHELGLDGSPSEIGTHGEISDGSDHGDGGGDVVEHTVVAWLGEAMGDEGNGRDRHHGCDSLEDDQPSFWVLVHSTETHPKPVGAMGGNGNVSSALAVGGRIDFESLVWHVGIQLARVVVVVVVIVVIGGSQVI